MHLKALGVRVSLSDSLVALGGCHHLDGLEQRRSLTCVGDCSWLALVIVRGLVPSPAESRKATLVDCSCL